MDTKRFEEAYKAFMELEDSTDILDAVEKSNNQSLLAAIAAKHDRESYRGLVVPRITDPEAKEYVFLHGKHNETQGWIFNLIGYTEKEMIELYKLSDNSNACRILLSNIKDQAFLHGLLKNLTDEDLKSILLTKITDQQTILKHFGEVKYSWDRESLVNRIDDQTVLAKIAIEDEDDSVRLLAIEKISDQGTLTRVALEDEEQFNRIAAVERLEDQVLLLKLVEEDESSLVRQTAVEKIIEPEILLNLAKNSTDEDVQQTALKRAKSLG